MIKPRPFLKELIAGTLLGGLDALDKEAEPYIPSEVKEAIEAAPISAEFKNALLPLAERGVHSPIGAIVMMLMGMVIGSAFGIAAPIMRVTSYQIDKLIKSFRLDPGTVSQLWLRGFPKGQNAAEWAKLSPKEKAAETERQRDEVEKWFGHLSDQGFGSDEQEAVKALSQLLPTPQDLVMWQAREVFEPEMIEKYGLLDEVELIDRDLFYKVGMSDEMIENHWKAHWQHASWMQIVEMRRRELITDADVWEWFRMVEIPPFWRENLIKLIWEIPTRVDVRRWFDMGTVDETELRSIYGRQGYHGKDLDNYIIWTKVYVHFPDLMSRLSKGWITLEEVKKQLVEVDGMPEDRFEELLQTKIKAVEPEKVAKERELTRTDILKGIKLGKLTYDEGKELLMLMPYSERDTIYLIDLYAAPEEEIEEQVRERDLAATDILKAIETKVFELDDGKNMLIDMGYSSWEADVKIMLKLGVTTEEAVEEILAASPQRPMQFRQLVESYRHAVGLEFKEPSSIILEADRKRSDLRIKLAGARSRKAPEDEIAKLQADLEIAEVTFQNMKAAEGL